MIDITVENLVSLAKEYNSIFFNHNSLESALRSCGSLLSLVESVINGDVKNGFAIIRPPGHHAEVDCVISSSLWSLLTD